MGQMKNRRFVRTRREHNRRGRNASTPVLQPLEPRKLLTTLYAHADMNEYLATGYRSTFFGWIAMPKFWDGDSELDADSVEERSVLVRIDLFDSGPRASDPTLGPSVTILDLDGNPLIPWIGQRNEDGSFDTEVTVSLQTGDPANEDDDELWGTDDDLTFDGFGLDVGYIPGWEFLPGPDGEVGTADDVPVLASQFYPVRNLEYDEDGDPPGFDPENIAEDYTIVIPPTGFWDPGDDELYLNEYRLPYPIIYPFPGFSLPFIPEAGEPAPSTDDSRTPEGILGETDERRDVNMPSDIWEPPTDFSWHLLALPTTFDGTRVVDANDGIADFNNGIGQIIFNNVRSTTRLSITVWSDTDEPEMDTPFELHGDSDVGINVDLSNPEQVVQALGMGKVIIGNPTPYDWTVDQPLMNMMQFLAKGQSWTRDDEGIKFANPSANETMGRVFIDGALFGRNEFPGALEALHVGYLGGHLLVDGDLSALIVAGDAGYIDYEDFGPNQDGTTGGTINVGRTLGSFVVGGRLRSTVTVDGNLADPTGRPPLGQDNLVTELEYYDKGIPGLGPTYLDAEQETMDAFWRSTLQFYIRTVEGEDVDVLTNDTFGTAQFVGRATSRIVVHGDIGNQPDVGPHSGDGDQVDIFAVAVDGLTELRIDLYDFSSYEAGIPVNLPNYVTLQDESGRILASRGLFQVGGIAGGTNSTIRYTPDHAGIVYIVVDNSVIQLAEDTPYALVIEGVEPVTLGEVRAINGLLYTSSAAVGIMTRSGSVGAIRAGLDATEPTNAASIRNLNIDSAGSIWNVTAGFSIGGGADEDGNLGGDTVGTVISAQHYIGSILAGFAVGEGGGDDLTFMGGSIVAATISAGRDIGLIWARDSEGNYGDIGALATEGRAEVVQTDAVRINAGGSIGVIRAENRLWGDNTFITVGNGQVVDLVEVGMGPGNRDFALEEINYGVVDGQLQIEAPGGGNVRFFRSPHVFVNLDNSDDLRIGADETLVLVDDSGAEFSIRVTGGQAAGQLGSTSEARIVTQPVEGSRGVATVRIIANLHAGADLIITNNSGRVEIGDIIVFGSQFDTGQEIIFNGSGQTSVHFIRAFGAFSAIRNNTTGDHVAIDIGSVETVNVRGNLGRTRTVAIGPKLLGPQLGVAAEAPAEPTPLDPETIAALLEGLPGDGSGATVGGTLQADPQGFSGTENEPEVDGGPFDSWLNGLSVRATGIVQTLESVQVDGALGDLIAQTTIENVRINADGVTPTGEFHGLVGTVYSGMNIVRIDVGDGMAPFGTGPILNTGIMALGQVERVTASGEGHDIQGVIAGVGVATVGTQDVDFGIGRIELKNGASLRGALIMTNPWDDYWRNPLNAADGRVEPVADINRIKVTGGNIIDTIVSTVNLDRIEAKGGYWDSTLIIANDDIGFVRADEFRRTQAALDPTAFDELVYPVSGIVTSGSIRRIETFGGKGDIRDLVVDIQGDLERMRGSTIEGVTLNVDGFLQRIDAKDRLARTEIVAGRVDRVEAQNDIARLTLLTAGETSQIRSKKGGINRIEVDIAGPDGSLGKIEAQDDITGEITVAGDIDRIRAKSGDVDATITTTQGGSIKEIRAGRDLLMDLHLDGSLDKLRADRNIGDGGSIEIEGDLRDLDARKGAVNANIIIEGSLTKNFRAQSFRADSVLDVAGSINRVDLGGVLDATIISHSGGIARVDIDGNVNAGSGVFAYDGSITRMTVNGGNVGGTIHADENIARLEIKSSGGVGGDVSGLIQAGVNVDKLRIDGDLNGGRVMALKVIESLDVRGAATGALVAARVIDDVSIDGSMVSSHVLAGLVSLGADDELGGAGDNADVFSNGQIVELNVGGGIDDSVIAAGVSGGADGSFNPSNSIDPDTDLASGVSGIGSVTVDGVATGTNIIVADTSISDVEITGVQRTVGNPGLNLLMAIVNPDQSSDDLLPGVGDTVLDFFQGQTRTVTEADGDVVQFTLTGPGAGYVETDGAGNVHGLAFIGTTAASNFTAAIIGGAGNGKVDLVNGSVRGADDASFNSFVLPANIDGSDTVAIDGSVNNFSVLIVDTTGSLTIGGSVNGRLSVSSVAQGDIRVFDVNVFETTNGGFAGDLDGRYIGSFSVRGGAFTGNVYLTEDAGTVSLGTMDGGVFGAEGSIGTFNASTMEDSTLWAGDVIDSVNVSGNVNESSLIAGWSLGSDGQIGGTGDAADELTTGSINRVTIRGNFSASNIAAGIDPGEDTFFGTEDDLGSVGFSAVGTVSIGGRATGSNFGSQQYAIIAAGDVGSVRDNQGDFDFDGRNLRVREVETSPRPLRVQSTDLRLEAGVFYLDIYFTEDVNEATVVDEANSAITIESADGGVDPTPADYTITYDDQSRRVTVAFDAAFIDANPGVYTLVIDGSAIESAAGLGLDVDGDGIAGDEYRRTVLLGDAGDRTVGGDFGDIQLEGATDLDLLLADPVTNDTANNWIDVIEQIGNHPQHDPAQFPVRMDVDVYSVTLDAGDIFKVFFTENDPNLPYLGTLVVELYNSSGELISGSVGLAEGFVVTASDTYYLTVMNADLSNRGLNITDPTQFVDTAGQPIGFDEISNQIGRYELNILIHDDGDTGFSLADQVNLIDGQTAVVEGDIGQPTNGVSRPSTDVLFDLFYPHQHLFNDGDAYDISRVRVGAGDDGIFGTGDDVYTTELAEGTTVTIRVRLEETGSNLGTWPAQFVPSAAEVGLFQTTNTSGVADALLIAAPGFSSPRHDKVNGATLDLEFTLRIPETGTYAVYIQGNLPTNYALEINVDTSTAGQVNPPSHQNVLLETRGIFADWVGRFGTQINAFSLDALGFAGFEDEVIDIIIQEVEADFAAAGVTVDVETNPALFDQSGEFTTVFLGDNSGEDAQFGDVTTADMYNFGALAGGTIFGDIYGISNNIDVLNQSKSDQAVVFVREFENVAAAGDYETLARTLADVVSHQVAITMGLRHNIADEFADPAPMMTPLLPFVPGIDQDFFTSDNPLLDAWFLGMQNDEQLLNYILA